MSNECSLQISRPSHHIMDPSDSIAVREPIISRMGSGTLEGNTISSAISSSSVAGYNFLSSTIVWSNPKPSTSRSPVQRQAAGRMDFKSRVVDTDNFPYNPVKFKRSIKINLCTFVKSNSFGRNCLMSVSSFVRHMSSSNVLKLNWEVEQSRTETPKVLIESIPSSGKFSQMEMK